MTSYHIPEPCHENWDAMSPTERGRHCAVCAKEVVDLTERDAAEARELLERKRAASGAICARVRVDQRKRLVLGRFRRHVLTNGLALLMATGAAGMLAGCEIAPPTVMGEMQPVAVDPDPDPQPKPDPGHEIMGDVVMVEMGEIAPQPGPKPEPQPDAGIDGAVADPKPAPVVVPQPQPQVVMGRIASHPPKTD